MCTFLFLSEEMNSLWPPYLLKNKVVVFFSHGRAEAIQKQIQGQVRAPEAGEAALLSGV